MPATREEYVESIRAAWVRITELLNEKAKRLDEEDNVARLRRMDEELWEMVDELEEEVA